jgi:hypothetical protein
MTKVDFCQSSGSCHGKSNPTQHHYCEPPEDDCESGPTFGIADAGNADRGQYQRPNCEDIKGGKQSAQYRRAVGANKISKIGSHWVLNIK